jgi:hypothetical protein
LQFHNKKGNEVKSKGQGTSIIKELRNWPPMTHLSFQLWS